MGGDNRPTIAGDWGFWADAELDGSGRATGIHILEAPLDGSTQPVEVAPHAYMLGGDHCSSSPAIVYVDPGEVSATASGMSQEPDPKASTMRVLRRQVGPGGAGAAEVLTTIPRGAGEGLVDFVACDNTVVWSINQAGPPVGTAAGSATLGGDGDTQRTETVWIDQLGSRTHVTVADTGHLRDLAIGDDYVGFSDVGPSNSAANYQYRLDDRSVFRVPTTLGVGGGVFRVEGSYGRWIEPGAGHSAREAMTNAAYAAYTAYAAEVIVHLVPAARSTASATPPA